MQVTVERRGDQRKARDTGNVDQRSSAPVGNSVILSDTKEFPALQPTLDSLQPTVLS
jgi:hypothetical protein